MTKASDFRDQTVDELNALLNDKRRDKFMLLNKRQKEKKIDKPHELRNMRKDIARILTVLSQKASGKKNREAK
jgi:large subunit ribosomal protein L29